MQETRVGENDGSGQGTSEPISKEEATAIDEALYYFEQVMIFSYLKRTISHRYYKYMSEHCL